MSKAFLGLVVGLALASPAWALHVFTPPWVANPNDPHWTGAKPTSQSWEFWGAQLGTTEPAHVNNPYAPPDRPPTFTPIDASPQFVPDGPGLTGVNTWHVDVDGGGFTLGIPDDPRQRDFKAIHLQYTSDKSSTGAPTTQPGGTAQAGGAAGVSGTLWYTYEWTLVIKPNPPFETITVRFPASANIGEIDVSTVCVPEPTTFALLGMGVLGLAAVAWRSRKRG